jgi:hypothetical protein
MLEISIFCVILFAIAYWATLFIMGRREDVLHGEFVEAGPELADVAVPASAPMPVFPPKPVIKRAVVSKTEPVAAVASKPEPVTAPAPPPVAAIAAPEKPANAEALQSLLVSLKQELKNAAQI